MAEFDALLFPKVYLNGKSNVHPANSEQNCSLRTEQIAL